MSSNRTPVEDSRVSRTPRLRWIPLGKLRVNSIAQRELNEAWVATLEAEFDPDKMSPPHVSERGDHFNIVDGQHGTEACKRWLGEGWETQNIQCWVYTGLDDAEEAALFDALNNKRTVHAFDKFRIRVAGNFEVESEIERIVRAQGLVISRDHIPGAISCVGTLRRARVRSDAPTLGRTLRICRDAFGDAGLDSFVIDGISRLCERYNGQLEEPVAIEKLSKTLGGVNGLLAKAEVLRRQTGAQKAYCVAAAAVEIINQGKGGKKLPSWWK